MNDSSEMEKAKLPTLTQQSKQSVVQSTLELQQLERLKEANEAAIKVCKGCVDFGKTSKDSFEAALALVTEYLAGLSPEMMRRVTMLGEGILLKSKFIPTVADYHALVLELQAKDVQFKPAHTHYRRFDPDNFVDEKTPEQRREFIKNLRLHEQFPEGAYLRDKPVRIAWDDEKLGAPTEAKVKPEGSKFKLPDKFPEHLWDTTFMKHS